MLTTITCPSCKTDGKLSLVDPHFDGPYKCWKCKEVFRLRMDHGTVEDLSPMTAEEQQQFEQAQALRNKFRR